MNSTLGYRNRVTSNRAGKKAMLAAALVILPVGQCVGMANEIHLNESNTAAKKADALTGPPQQVTVGPATGMQPTGKSGLHGRVFALDASGDITGVVSGAKIEWKSQGGQAVATVTSSKHGYYTANLTPGVYHYKVTASGYKDEDVRRGVSVQLSDGYAIYNFSMTPGKTDPQQKPDPIPPVAIGKLAGHVLERTPGGRMIGIPQATVSLRNEGANPPQLDVTTAGAGGRDENPGRYGVTLEAGPWQAAASAPGFETLVEPNPIRIVSGRQQTHNFILTRSQPEPPPSDQGIRGTIWVRGADRSKAALPQVKVSVLPIPAPGGSIDPRGPDAKGSYDCNVSAGSYRVVAELEGYRTARSQPRTVYPGKYTVVDLTLMPIVQPPDPTAPAPQRPPTQPAVGPKMRLRILARLPREQSVPLPGARVVIKQGERVVDSGQSEGREAVFTSKPLLAGLYQAFVSKQDFGHAGLDVFVWERDVEREIVLARAGEEEPDINPPPWYEQPDMEPPNERPGEERPPWFEQPDMEPPNERPGEERPPWFEQPDMEPPPHERPGEEPPPQMRPQATVEVEVVARDQRGVLRLVPAAQVSVRHADREIARQMTDPRGRCRLRLPHDHYELVAGKEGYRMARQSLRLFGDAVRRIELARVGSPERPSEPGLGPGPGPGQDPPRPKANLQVEVVQVLRGRSLPIPGAQVEVFWAGRRVASQQANGAGRAAFRLNRDDYELRAHMEGFHTGRHGISLKRGDGSTRIVLGRGESPGTRPSPPAQPREATLQVHVVRRAVRGLVSPVAGAHIAIYHGGRHAAAARTNHAGQATLRLRPGEYEIRVDKEGYHHHRQGLDFRRPGAPVRIEIRTQEGGP